VARTLLSAASSQRFFLIAPCMPFVIGGHVPPSLSNLTLSLCLPDAPHLILDPKAITGNSLSPRAPDLSIDIFHNANIHFPLTACLCLPHDRFHKLLSTLGKSISMMTSLTLFGNKVLRAAIERNLVTFPAQTPEFAKNQSGEVQARIAQLYFVAGWTIRDIGNRYQMNSEMVRKTLNEWRVRAISSGYIQEIQTEIQPTLSSLAEAEDAEENESVRETSAGRVTNRPRTGLTIVAPQPVPSVAVNVPAMLLHELEAAVVQSSCWEPFCLRLLHLLKQECRQFGLPLSVLQIERIEAALDVDPQRAGDLLRDLRCRIADEQVCTPVLGDQGPGRPHLLQSLLGEIETTVHERSHDSGVTAPALPGHCMSLLIALKQGCTKLGLEFSLAQIKRIESAFSADSSRLEDLLRDLRNRLSDELEYTELVFVPERPARQLTAGVNR
jgi:transposase-like protein